MGVGYELVGFDCSDGVRVGEGVPVVDVEDAAVGLGDYLGESLHQHQRLGGDLHCCPNLRVLDQGHELLVQRMRRWSQHQIIRFIKRDNSLPPPLLGVDQRLTGQCVKELMGYDYSKGWQGLLVWLRGVLGIFAISYSFDLLKPPLTLHHLEQILEPLQLDLRVLPFKNLPIRIIIQESKMLVPLRQLIQNTLLLQLCVLCARLDHSHRLEEIQPMQLVNASQDICHEEPSPRPELNEPKRPQIQIIVLVGLCVRVYLGDTLDEMHDPNPEYLPKDGGDLGAGSEMTLGGEDVLLGVEPVVRMGEAQIPVVGEFHFVVGVLELGLDEVFERVGL